MNEDQSSSQGLVSVVSHGSPALFVSSASPEQHTEASGMVCMCLARNQSVCCVPADTGHRRKLTAGWGGLCFSFSFWMEGCNSLVHELVCPSKVCGARLDDLEKNNGGGGQKNQHNL